MNTITPAMQVGGLTLQNRIRKLVPIVRPPREVRRQKLTGFADRVHDRVGEILRLEMRPHRPGQSLPERIAASLVHSLVPNDRELLRAGRDKDEDRVSLAGLCHAEPSKLFSRGADWIGHVTMLHEDANLA